MLNGGEMSRALLRGVLALCLVVALPVLSGLFVTPPQPAAAHPGGLDSSGCHTCHTNCTEKYGIPYESYHCHGGGTPNGAPTPTAPPTTVPRDTTPPPVPVVSGVPAVETGSVTLTMAAEAGASIVCASNVAGQLFTASGTGAPQPIGFDVPVGSHSISCTAADGAGNVSPAYTTQATYAAPTPPKLRQLTRRATAPLVIQVSGTTGTVVTVALSDGQTQTVPLTSSSMGTASFDVPDGTYSVDAAAADRKGTASTVTRLDVTADATAPKLAIAVNKERAKDGSLTFKVMSESGTDVTVRTKGTKLRRNYVATSKPRTFSKNVVGGRFVITATATDEHGNATTRKATVTIA